MIIFMGPAGAGKSVQGLLLAESLNYKWVSTGDYLRKNLTEERKARMMAGDLISDEEIIEIIKKCFFDIKDVSCAIIDGFPRTINQAKWLVEESNKGTSKIKAVIFLNVSKEVSLKRLLERGRDDDKEEIINKRYEEYERITRPIIDWFIDSGVRVYDINADSSVEQIHQKILDNIKK